MGAINNVFNQAAGAVAGAGLIIQHAKETDFSKMNAAENAALTARNQYRDVKAEAKEATDEAMKDNGLYNQLAVAGRNTKKAERAYDEAKNRKNGAIKTILKKRNDLIAAQEAEQELKNKYKALSDLRDRANEQRVHAEKAAKIAEEAQQKYQSRWGGK